ncbi:MAG: hypothetical protein QMB63_03185 [Clostridiaceae bacterium]
MRRVIIQIFSVYFTMIYFGAAFSTEGEMRVYFLICAVLNAIVAIKITKYKSKANLFYNGLFLFFSLSSSYFVFTKFDQLNLNITSKYIFLTFPTLIKNVFLLLNMVIFLFALMEFLNSTEQ